MNKIEPLDYCRVKKIFEKGFGFLESLYYPRNVFFHFSRIKDAEVKEKLENLKRGEVYLFYTSKEAEGKRKVNRLWLDIKNADRRLLPDFIDKLIHEMNFGNRNPFELTTVIGMLREKNLMPKDSMQKVMASNKLLRIPTATKFIFTENDLEIIQDLEIGDFKLPLEKKVQERIVELIF